MVIQEAILVCFGGRAMFNGFRLNSRAAIAVALNTDGMSQSRPSMPIPLVLPFLMGGGIDMYSKFSGSATAAGSVRDGLQQPGRWGYVD